MGRFKLTVRRYMLTGVMVLVPVFLTVWALVALLAWSDNVLRLIPPSYRPEALLGFPLPGLGLLMTLFIVFLIGGFVANVMGRQLLGFGERLLERIPLVRWFYFSSKRILEALFFKGRDSFRRVVLIEYPRKGLYSIGFVSGEARGKIDAAIHGRCFTVFVPTTPNPTSGYLIVVPESEIIPLNWTVDEAFNFVISAGVLLPGESGEPEPIVTLPPEGYITEEPAKEGDR